MDVSLSRFEIKKSGQSEGALANIKDFKVGDNQTINAVVINSPAWLFLLLANLTTVQVRNIVYNFNGYVCVISVTVSYTVDRARQSRGNQTCISRE